MYNKSMKRFLIIPFLTILLTSCVLYGTGTRTITGTLSGTVPANVKVGVFPPTSVFYYDNFTPGDPDKIFADGSTVIHNPVLYTIPSANTYTITLPEDPSTISSLISWDDANLNNQFDIATENAYLPVKTISGTDYVVHFFTSIDAQLITYIVNYSDISLYATEDFPNQFTDNFDAIGADGFNFIFD
jgi:hypothetical protein